MSRYPVDIRNCVCMYVRTSVCIRPHPTTRLCMCEHGSDNITAGTALAVLFFLLPFSLF